MSLQAEKALPPIPPPTPLPIRPYSPVTVVTFEPDEFEEIHVQPAPVATAATPAFSLPGAERLSGFFTTASSHIESLIGAIASRSSMILKGWEFQISVDAFNVPGLMEMSAKDPVLRAGVTALEEIFMATLLLKYHKAKCELLASCSARVLFAIRDLWSTTWEKERLRLATRGYALIAQQICASMQKWGSLSIADSFIYQFEITKEVKDRLDELAGLLPAYDFHPGGSLPHRQWSLALAEANKRDTASLVSGIKIQEKLGDAVVNEGNSLGELLELLAILRMHGASSAQKRPTRKSLALPGATNRNTRSSMMQSQLQCYKLGKKPVAQSTLYEIWEGMWQGSESVALKVLRHGDEAADYFPKYTRLSLIWSRLQSPYILPFLGTCAIDDSPFPPFVSPWCSYGNAHQYLKGNPRADRIQICLEIAFGLQYMHNLDEPVIHGSVNGRNVLISDDGVALLSGFGLSGTSGSPFTADDVPCSSYRWMAPEISRGELTKEGDIWAWGMTALELLSGMQPFYANQSPMTVLMKTMKGERPQKADYPNPILDGEMWSLLESCWELDPAGRPNIDEVVQTVKAIHAARNSR